MSNVCVHVCANRSSPLTLLSRPVISGRLFTLAAGSSYYEIKKNGISPFQNMLAYLGGSAIQTVGDNPVTAYRQVSRRSSECSSLSGGPRA